MIILNVVLHINLWNYFSLALHFNNDNLQLSLDI